MENPQYDFPTTVPNDAQSRHTTINALWERVPVLITHVEQLIGRVTALETANDALKEELRQYKEDADNLVTRVQDAEQAAGEANDEATAVQQAHGATLLKVGRLERDLKQALSAPSQGAATGVAAQDPKATPPPKFSGKKSEYENFKSATKIYINSRPRQFGPSSSPNDRARSIYVLGLLEGAAMTWASNIVDTIDTTQESPLLNSYSQFLAALDLTYGDPNKPKRALARLHGAQQTGSAAQYVSDFRNDVVVAGLTEFIAIYDYFYRGLKSHVKDELTKNPPKNMEDAYEAAILWDNRQWERSMEKKAEGGSNKPPQPKPRAEATPRPTYTPPRAPAPTPATTTARPGPPNPDAMEIDAATGRWVLKPEERKHRMEKGLCFRCGQAGHAARDCGKSKVGSSTLAATTTKPPVDDNESVDQGNEDA